MISNLKRSLAFVVAAFSLATGSLNVMATPVTEFTRDQATSCTLDGTYQVNVTSENNSSWYSFTAPEAGTYAFFTSDAGESDPLLLLYDSNIMPINYNDDAGVGDEESESYVSAVLDAGETVYIQATLSDYEISNGSYQLHITKGLAFYFDYNGEKYYYPWFGYFMYIEGGDDLVLRVSGDISYRVTDATGDLSDYIGGDVVFQDVWKGKIGTVNVLFSIGEYDFFNCINVRFSYYSYEGNCDEMISGYEGFSYEYVMVDPGDSYEVYDTSTTCFRNLLTGFYQSASSDIQYLPEATVENRVITIRDTIEDITEFTYVRIIADNMDRYQWADRIHNIFVSDPNAPQMEIDTNYHVSDTFPGQAVLNFTPRLTGSYTISSLNVNSGDGEVYVFDQDNQLIGIFSGDTVYTNHLGETVGYETNYSGVISYDMTYRTSMDRLLTYYYFHYGNEDPTVPENTNMNIRSSHIGDSSITLDLTAGQTYSIAIAASHWQTDADDQDIRVTWNGSEPYPTPSPTPTSAPTTEPTSAPVAQPTTSPEIDEPITGPVVPAANYSIGDFVERLYTVALGRPSDPEGKQDWIDAVTLRGQTGADLARGFLYSPEFLQKNVSNEEFVRVLYRTFFNRDADPDGLAGWVAVLDNGGSKEGVIEGFINSTEWANLCLLYGVRSGGTGVPNIEVEPNQQTIDFATRLYTTCLGRSADQNGLRAWARQLANQRDTGTGAARGFFFSNEFTGQNVSNDEYVNRLYRTFMGREADEAGFNAWVAQLNEGVSREEVFEGFAQSPEFTRICASYGIIR